MLILEPGRSVFDISNLEQHLSDSLAENRQRTFPLSLFALAAASTRALSGMLYGVEALDLTTFAGVALLVFLVAGFASLFPALRASRVEPMRVLREE